MAISIQPSISLSVGQARRAFLALHFQRPDCGAKDPVDQVIAHVTARCAIQFDPLNLVGMNPDLVLQSRVRNYRPSYLRDALYKRRALVDGYDKNLCFYPAADYPALARTRQGFYGWFMSPEVEAALPAALDFVRAHGASCPDDLDMPGKVRWPWGQAPLARAALETLWLRGALVIHHREGARRWFDLAERHLPAGLLDAPDPFPDEGDWRKWQVLRRVRSVGFLWNRGSDAFLGLNLKAPERDAAFRALVDEGVLIPLAVEGIRDILYLPAGERWALDAEPDGHARVIAPLDNLMWDRRLIEALFGFKYSLEVYVPASKRQYGYYVLPVVMDGRFVARFEPKRARPFDVAAWWDEPGRRVNQRRLKQGMDRFAAYVERLDR